MATVLEDFANSYLLATSMKREDFGTIEQYVSAFRKAVQNANRQEGMSVQPLAASRTTGWPTNLGSTIKHDISKNKNPGKMTEEDLLALYEKAVDQGRNRERSYVSKDKKVSPPQKPHNRNPIFPRASKHFILPNRKENHLPGE